MSVGKELAELEKRVVSRIRELEAAVTELEELRTVAARLGLKVTPQRRAGRSRSGATRKRATSGTRKRAATRTRRATRTAARSSTTSSRSAASSSRSRRPRGGRETQVLELVTKRPGITVTEIAKQLSVQRTSLYRVVRSLEGSGQIKKQGPALHPKG